MDWVAHIDALIREFLLWASGFGPWVCLAGLLAVLFLETSLFVGLIVPGETAVLLAASVVGHRWTPALFLVIVAASVLGQTAGYWLGRLVGPGIRRTWFGRKLGQHRWDRAESIVQGTGGRALITTRFVPFVHAVAPAAAGTLRIRFSRFLLLATAGAALWAIVLTVATLALGGAAQLVGYGWIGLLLSGMGCIGAVTTVLRALRQQRSRHSQGREPSHEPMSCR